MERARVVVLGLLIGFAFAAAPATQPMPKIAASRPGQKYRLVYRLSDGNENWPADKRAAIIKAMDGAVGLYNEIGEFDKIVTANYSPGTPTADANYDGWINFGGQIGKRTALHEIGHTLGVGTCSRWKELLVDGKWTGTTANALLKSFDGGKAELHGDRQHFWPYGLNFDAESSPEKDRRHVRMIAALRDDMGIINGQKEFGPTKKMRSPATTRAAKD